AAHNPHMFTGLEVDLDTRLVALDAPHDLVDLFLAQRGGLVAHADKAGHTRRIPHHVPAIFIHEHVDQDVAGKDAPFDFLARAFADLDLGLGGNYYIENA